MSQIWMLLGRPDMRHVPYFARSTSSSYETRKSALDSATAARRVGSRALRWLAANGACRFEFVITRNYLPPNAAFYAEWLVIDDKALAQSFQTEFPKLDAQDRRRRLDERAGAITREIAARIGRGGFDLSKHPVEHRRAIAECYIRLDTELHDVESLCQKIDLALELLPEWEKRSHY